MACQGPTFNEKLAKKIYKDLLKSFKKSNYVDFKKCKLKISKYNRSNIHYKNKKILLRKIKKLIYEIVFEQDCENF